MGRWIEIWIRRLTLAPIDLDHRGNGSKRWLPDDGSQISPRKHSLAVWTGIGTAGTAALGMYLFEEPGTLLQLSSIGLIVAGIIGFNLTS